MSRQFVLRNSFLATGFSRHLPRGKFLDVALWHKLWCTVALRCRSHAQPPLCSESHSDTMAAAAMQVKGKTVNARADAAGSMDVEEAEELPYSLINKAQTGPNQCPNNAEPRARQGPHKAQTRPWPRPRQGPGRARARPRQG